MLRKSNLTLQIPHAIIVSPFHRRKSLSETLERPLRAENRVFLRAPNANEPPHKI